jgi:hypothetical protein
MHRWSVTTRSLAWLTLLWIAPWITACQPAQPVSWSGWFHVIWYDGPPGSGSGGVTYWLDEDRGRTYQLLLDEKLLEPLGGPLALNGQRVRVIADEVSTPPGALRVLSIELERPLNSDKIRQGAEYAQRV